MDYVTLGIIIFVVFAILFIARYALEMYNEFVTSRIQVESQASDVEVAMKKKYDLIPQLLEVMKDYTKHEKGTFEEVTKLRSQWSKQGSFDGRVQTANMLEGALSKLMLVQERYPDLKADKSFGKVQDQMGNVEETLMTERKRYNQCVKDYNLKLQLFPGNVFGRLFGFTQKPFFTLKNK